MIQTPEQQLKSIRKTLNLFWIMINNQENVEIYRAAYMHGVKLSDNYLKAIKPLNKEIKKFLRIKNA